jgi:NADPH:quinone reductase-like Zn-dependent oxidoreductase
MDSMKAIVCDKYGPPEVLRLAECRRPVAKDDEVLVRIYATSVTNSDLFIRGSDVPLQFMIPMRIMMGFRGPRKKIIGEVFAGEIAETGKRTTRFKVGDRVYGLTGFSLGAYADYKAMRETDSKQGCIAIMPRNLGFEEATSAAYGGLLALQFLEKAHIRKGQKVLIYGASGTSGVIALQYAKHLGAEVSCACSEEKAGFVSLLGADKVLDYANEESIGKMETYDFVLDCVGKRRSSRLKQACREHVSDKQKLASIDDSALLLDSSRLDRVRELVEAGAIVPVTDRIYPFGQIVEAHRYVELGHKRGNVAVTVNTKA